MIGAPEHYKRFLRRRSPGVAPQLIAELQATAGYGAWTAEQRFELLVRLGERVRDEPGIGFRVTDTAGDQLVLANWRGVAGWWMQSPGALPPEAQRLRKWQRFVTENVEFKLGVAVGAAVAQAWGQNAGALETPTLETWRATSGLPWVGFWFRELLRWGTLDPLVAFALAQGMARTREEAAARRPEFQQWLIAEDIGRDAGKEFHRMRVSGELSADEPFVMSGFLKPDARNIFDSAFDFRMPAIGKLRRVMKREGLWDGPLDHLNMASLIMAREDSSFIGFGTIPLGNVVACGRARMDIGTPCLGGLMELPFGWSALSDFCEGLVVEDLRDNVEIILAGGSHALLQLEGLLGEIRALQQNGYDLLRGMSAAGSALLDLANRTKRFPD